VCAFSDVATVVAAAAGQQQSAVNKRSTDDVHKVMQHLTILMSESWTV
jgi:hypothetical protein